MKVLVIGSGGREHALVWKIAQSPLVDKIYCAPGNPGTAALAENISINASELHAMKEFAVQEKIDLTVVGPEDPLVNGIVDLFKAAGLVIFGPNQAAAQLEGSKAFSKNLMKKYGIPTAAYEVFTGMPEAVSYIETRSLFPVVIKASGLAAGKGVLICPDKNAALAAVRELMGSKVFGSAGDEVVIEDFLEGPEVSIFAITDGTNYKLFAPSQDHKKALDNDQGLNTGGMGAYSPTPLLNSDQLDFIKKQAVQKTLDAMRSEGSVYRGLLYVGLMLTADGPKVLEYNCRFGDPETEVVLPLLKSDLVPLLLAGAQGGIKDVALENKPGYALDVVLASGGYPQAYKKGMRINGLEALDEDILVFHAGTKLEDGNLQTAGGRVLNIVATGSDYHVTRQRLYDNITRVHFTNMHYRRDIGGRVAKLL